MAILSDNDRAAIWADLMREASAAWEALGLSKAEFRAAVNATDQWIDDNSGSFNSALPLPARTALTAKQKVRLFLEVAKRRWEVA